MANFDIEKYNHYKNIYMIGVDEVGRGSWAGPIVATSCWIDFEKHKLLSSDINDSKQLSPKKRNKIVLSLNKCVKFSSAISTAREIDHYGLTLANFMAMKRSLYSLFEFFNNLLTKNNKNFNVYIDGNKAPNFCNVDITLKTDKLLNLQSHVIHSLVKGDNKSKTIALASIIAKETRDSIMRNYSIKYPEYNFNQHFGYGTEKHSKALLKFGITPIHRKSFKPISTIYGGLK